MKIKTKGKCAKCNGMYSAEQAGAHLLDCALQSDAPSKSTTAGYIIRISWAEQPGMHWIFATIPKNASLALLDDFLRTTWLECCGHLSEFTIGDRHYMSHNESGGPSQSMNKQVGQVLLPGSMCEYVYDMGSSTYLEIQVLGEVHACPQKQVTILMQNNPPELPCESCKKPANLICSQCGNATCTACSKHHPCAVSEEDDYMLMPLVNSPRAGVCGYEGN